MLRPILLAAAASFAIAAAARAQDEPQPRPPSAQSERAASPRPDPFVISNDACGASRFAHLMGQDYGELYQASLIPSHSNRYDRIRPITLEYTPYRLNFVVNGEGRIVAIGCF
jgi:hypothetical protein